jgi:hypothetical protein
MFEEKSVIENAYYCIRDPGRTDNLKLIGVPAAQEYSYLRL